MKILIPTIMKGRWATFKVFAQGVKDLQEFFPEHEINCLVVGTGDESIVNEYGFEYHEYKNTPLANKAEHRLKLSKDKADYYLFLGSDDIISPLTFKHYLSKIDQGCDFIAPLDLYLHYKKNIYYSIGYPNSSDRYGEPLAVGRCVSNELLTKCGWSLWTSGRHKNIDREAFKKLESNWVNPYVFSIRSVGGMILDIKTIDNINPFNPSWQFMGDPNKFLPNSIAELL